MIRRSARAVESSLVYRERESRMLFIALIIVNIISSRRKSRIECEFFKGFTRTLPAEGTFGITQIFLAYQTLTR